MNASLPELFQALRRTLQDAVRPHIADDHAAGQLAAVADILGKLERTTAWSAQAAAEQARVLVEGGEAFVAHAAAAGVIVEEPAAATADNDALHAAEDRVNWLTDWLFDAPAELGPATRAELDALLRDALKQQLVLQRRLIPLTDFSAMTAGASKD